MLKNDPPKQTLLRFLKSVEQAKRGEQATLIGPVKTYHVDRPDDLFTVHYSSLQGKKYNRSTR